MCSFCVSKERLGNDGRRPMGCVGSSDYDEIIEGWGDRV